MLEKEMPTHSIILAWEVLWTEEPGRLQFMGSQNSQTWLSQSVVPRHLCTGNPWVIWGLRTPVTVHLQRYNQHCISLVPHPRIQPAMVCVVLQYVFVGKINLRYRWILAVQTHVVQGSTVHWHCCTAVTIIHFQNFFYLAELKFSVCWTPYSPLLPAPGDYLSIFYLYLFDCFKHLTWMELYGICPFLMGLFH